MESFRAFRRPSVSHGYKRENEETESLLGGDADTILQIDAGLHLKKREGSTSSFNRQKLRDQTMECDIQPTDTLVSLAFKYNVQVAQLKRVNNILSDAEFFARKKIKIPVRQTSLLTEILPGDPPQQEIYDNNNGWKVENKEESPNKSLISISVCSDQSSPGGGWADSDGLVSPQIMKDSKQKKAVRNILKEVDKDLDMIRLKQEGIENKIKETEAVEQSINLSKKIDGAVSDTNCSSFKLACVCMFLVVGCLVIMGGLVTFISIEHNEVEEGDEW